MSSSFKLRLSAVCAATALLALTAQTARAEDAAASSRVMIAQRVIDAASAYNTYVSAAGAVKSDFADRDAVRAALLTAASYEADQLHEGEIAFAALTALQDPKFVNSVRGYAAFPGAIDRMAERLLADPDAIYDLPEAQAAAIRVGGILRAQGARVIEAGVAAKKAAYSVQLQQWSKESVVDAPARLTRIKSMSQSRSRASKEDAQRLIAAITAAQASDPRGSTQITKAVSRGLAIAALAVVGRAGEDNAVQLAALLSQPGDRQCLKMAKLNLFQCLAVAGPQYEDIFCLGEHALKDTGQCVVESAGRPAALAQAMPVAPAPTEVKDLAQAPAASAAPEAVFVPVANAPLEAAPAVR